MDARASLRRASTLAGALADQLRAGAPASTSSLDLTAAAAALRRVGADVTRVRVDARSRRGHRQDWWCSKARR